MISTGSRHSSAEEEKTATTAATSTTTTMATTTTTKKTWTRTRSAGLPTASGYYGMDLLAEENPCALATMSENENIITMWYVNGNTYTGRINLHAPGQKAEVVNGTLPRSSVGALEHIAPFRFQILAAPRPLSNSTPTRPCSTGRAATGVTWLSNPLLPPRARTALTVPVFLSRAPAQCCSNLFTHSINQSFFGTP